MLSVTIVGLKLFVLREGSDDGIHKKALIVKLWKDGESYRNISSNLNIPFTTISSYIARFKRRNTVEKKKKKPGAPRKISPRLSRKLGCLITQNPMFMREELQEVLCSS